MWRKPAEVKPSSKPSDVPATSVPVPSKPEPPKAAFQPEPPVTVSVPVLSAPPARPAAIPDAPGMSRITSGLKIRGEMSGSSDLYIDGETQGKIQLGEARVTVGPNGRVQADIDAREINIEGTVKGNLKARESVRLGPSSQMEGSVLTPRIGIDDGARLRGKVEMTRPDDTPKPSKTERATNSGNLRPMASRSESE